MSDHYVNSTATNIRRNVKYALRVLPVTEENNRLLDIIHQIDSLASEIEKRTEDDT